MKKVLLAVFVLALFVPVVKADEVEAYFKWGKLEKKDVRIVSLYELSKGNGLIGGEKMIASKGLWSLDFGAVSSFLGHGTPYLSIDYDFAKITPFIKNTLFGTFVGKDFNVGGIDKGWIWGFKIARKI